MRQAFSGMSKQENNCTMHLSERPNVLHSLLKVSWALQITETPYPTPKGALSATPRSPDRAAGHASHFFSGDFFSGEDFADDADLRLTVSTRFGWRCTVRRFRRCFKYVWTEVFGLFHALCSVHWVASRGACSLKFKSLRNTSWNILQYTLPRT